MKNKNSAELRNLAKNLKASAVKVSKAVTNCPKSARVPGSAGWCGRNSKLSVETKWNSIRYGVFDAMKHDRGHNGDIIAAIAQLKHNQEVKSRV